MKINLKNTGLPISIIVIQTIILWLDTITPLGIAMGVAYVFPVLLSLWVRSFSFTVFVASTSTLLTLTGIILSAGAMAPPEVYLTNRSLSIAAIIITAYLGIKQNNVQAEQAQLNIELTDALVNIKTLRGLLPICANCKKIRNDSGLWEQIETYVRDNSDADFSHSICPDCMDKFYPDLKK